MKASPLLDHPFHLAEAVEAGEGGIAHELVRLSPNRWADHAVFPLAQLLVKDFIVLPSREFGTRKEIVTAGWDRGGREEGGGHIMP